MQGYSSVQQDLENESQQSIPNLRQRKSFFQIFCSTNGPPQVVLVTFLTTLSYGAIVSILPQVGTQRFAVLNYGYDGEECASFAYKDKPQECLKGSADAQDAHAFSEFVANIFIVLTGPLFGSITDTHGRRQWFVVGTVMAVLGIYAFFYVCVKPSSNPWIFYGIRSLHGLVNWIAISLSTIADVMPPEFRAPAVGQLMAAYWFGVCIGPTIAVFLGNMNAVIFSCIVATLAILIAVLFVPETLPPIAAEEARRQRTLEHSHRTAGQVFLWYLFRPIREISIVNRDGFFRLLSTLAFFNGMVTSGDKVLLLYYVESRLNFSMSDTAIMLLLYGFGTTFAQGIVLKPLNDMLGERFILIISFVTALVCNTCYGLAKTKGALFGGISLASLAAMAFPTFSAIKANNVNESEQGRVQGALYAILALASGIGPMAMRYVDRIASGTFLGPGAMFLFAACLQLIAAFFTCWLPRERTDSRCRTNQQIPVEDDPFDGNHGDELVELS